MSWASSERLVQSAINFYVRCGQWRHIQVTVNAGLKKLGNDPTLHFWAAAGLLLEGRVPEGMRDLQKSAESRDVALACALALIHGHRQSTWGWRALCAGGGMNVRRGKGTLSMGRAVRGGYGVHGVGGTVCVEGTV